MVFAEGAAVTDLPHAVRALWGLDDAAGRRGPKRSLSVQAIGAAAVEIADADGLAAVSMASVAQRLGTTAMALYRHVSPRARGGWARPRGRPPATPRRGRSWRWSGWPSRGPRPRHSTRAVRGGTSS